ncbi:MULTISPECIES: glycosyltransferase family 9 protein [Vibrio harveyi group]|uniref:glycosyltransferase family 9 protein n=1 Tax=Vibrio harveyi group TaxID=717610 RepID=UPI000576CBCD|nr:MULTISPECIES: glycosyltransferase family 9 protein [Vibrio harveyi group]
MAVKTFLRNFDKQRRRLTHQLEPKLAGWLNDDSLTVHDPMPHDQVKRILIVRNNSRIGNMYFLLPFVHQVLRLYPNATVDLLLNSPWQGEVFKNLGINQIHYSNLSFKSPDKALATIRLLKREKYDLLFAPTAGACDTFLSALIPAKNKIAFKKVKTEQVFTHSSVADSPFRHGAYKPLSILEAMGHELDNTLDHHIVFDSKELSSGIQQARKLREEGKPIFAFFRGARGKKKLSDHAWLTILAEFERKQGQSVNWVEVLSPDIQQPLLKGSRTLACKDLRQLGATLRYLDGFLCCDTGPLHLADAAGATCFGFYTETCPQRFGLMGEKCHAIRLFLSEEQAEFEPVLRMA